ncbi:hypothetical protein PAXINDRAFT_20565 [Paxillus involutus ATCC 200175]|uniref:Uncharacterized protein n=1 Tax=Paxillus involutus ATCC 200175 TaxID=664439 RepID=A0A0C9TDG7_PAXIN|nr:hypothetical protein PAXINDRAFT_20565 [Paxillus involutus ATCC 200175]
MAEIPQLRVDGRNWTEYREKLLRRNTIVKSLIVETIPDSIFLQILHYESAHKFLEALKNLFEKDIATLELLQELRNNRSRREATYGLESANDRVRRRSHVTDKSRRDDDISNRSVRRQAHVPSNRTRPERKRKPQGQGRVEEGHDETRHEPERAAKSARRVESRGRGGKAEAGKTGKGEAAATGPGEDTADQIAGGISRAVPSSQGSDRGDQGVRRICTIPQTLDTPHHETVGGATADTADPNALQSTSLEGERGYSKSIDGTAPDSRSADDEDGDDVDIGHAHVVPHPPSSTRRTANEEATGTTNPDARCAGTTMSKGKGGEVVEDVEEEDEKGGRASESTALSSNDDGGDEDVRHAYVVPKPASPSPNHVPPPPDESRPPPSVSLEGEMSGKQSSDHADEAATHLERPPDESTTMPPVWTPPDKKSSGEGRGTAMSHREAIGGDDSVEGSNDGRDMSNRVNEWRRREDKARDDEERQENREEEVRMGDEAERHNDAAEGVAEFLAGTSIEGEDEHSPRTPPQPPPSSPLSPPSPIPPTSPPYPERRGDDVDTTKPNKTPARRRGETKKPPSVRLEGESGRRSSLHVETDDDLKSSKTATRTRADAMHAPGGETDAPGSQPPSVRLEGEKDKASSLYVEFDHVGTDDDHAEDDDYTQQPSRHPVGTTDGDERRPSKPTEPPDEKEGDRGVDGKSSRVEGVEGVESKTSRRVDKPGGKGDEGDDEELRSREVEDKAGGQSDDEDGHRDGRTIDTGSPTSGTSHDSLRVETGALADNKAGQQCNGKPNVSTNSPGPSTPFPYITKRPTHIANPPRRRGRLKTLSTNVSRTRAYGLRTKSDGHADHLPAQPDATETVRSYRGSVPKPPQSRTKGTKAHTSTPTPSTPPSIPANYHIG